MSSRISPLYYLVQSTILLGGALYAWSIVYHNFLNYFSSTDNIPLVCLNGGTVLSVCFFGAIIFLMTFIWSLIIYRSDQGKNFCMWSERVLAGVLTLTALWAWFLTGLYHIGTIAWANTELCPIKGSYLPIEDPVFYGATIFTVACLWAILIVLRTRISQGK